MKNLGSYPKVRLRRNRKTEWSRRLVSENNLSTNDLIWPIFIREGKRIREPIHSMPGVYRYSLDQIEKIVNRLGSNGFKIIPCILLPSHKNLKSAEFLKIDWSDYKENIVGFINEIHGITSDILITSPNDFKRAYETISKLAI